MISRKLMPWFLTATLTAGCVSVRHIEDVSENNCWTTKERISLQGKGKKEKVVEREILSNLYDERCGDRLLEKTRAQASASVERARIDAGSAFLTQIVNTTRDQKLLSDAYRRIVERLDSGDAAIRASQYEAMIKAGLTEQDVRAQTIQCRMETNSDGAMHMVCN